MRPGYAHWGNCACLGAHPFADGTHQKQRPPGGPNNASKREGVPCVFMSWCPPSLEHRVPLSDALCHNKRRRSRHDIGDVLCRSSWRSTPALDMICCSPGLEDTWLAAGLRVLQQRFLARTVSELVEPATRERPRRISIAAQAPLKRPSTALRAPLERRSGAVHARLGHRSGATRMPLALSHSLPPSG